MTQPPLSSVPPPSVPKSSHRNRSIGAVAFVVGLVIGLAIGIFSSPILLPTQTGTGINNQVQVSGTVSILQTGSVRFYNLGNTIQSSAPIINGKYSVLLVGGQSYHVYVDNSNGGTVGSYSLYVPSGVATFTANF